MLSIAYYCSYKLSQTGYQLGLAAPCAGASGEIALSRGGIPAIAEKCFTARSLRRASGPLPDGSCFIELRKNINGELGGVPFYLNFCLISDGEGEFARARAFLARLDDAALFGRMTAPLIIKPDDAEFGLALDAGALTALARDIMASPPAGLAREERAFTVTASPASGAKGAEEFAAKKLRPALALGPELLIDTSRAGSGVYSVVPKSGPPDWLVAISVAAAAVMAALAALAKFNPALWRAIIGGMTLNLL